MFGPAFKDCWYQIPGVYSLELSGDLRFRGPRGLRKLRYSRNGRPYIQARLCLKIEQGYTIWSGFVCAFTSLIREADHAPL